MNRLYYKLTTVYIFGTMIFRFIQILKELHNDTLLDLRSQELGNKLTMPSKKYAALNERIFLIQANFYNYSVIDYLKALAHTTPQPTIGQLVNN